jgi:hypothetical protein
VIGGSRVTIYGHGFGNDAGKIIVGGEELDPIGWADQTISFAASHKNLGPLTVTVKNSAGTLSNVGKINVVERKLIPVRFTVVSPPLTAPGQQVFITGSTSMLGLGKTTWDDAAGPMIYSDDDRRYILCVPMPAGKDVQVKMVVLDADGKVVKSESAFHNYKVPPEGCWKNDLVWIP